MIAWNVYLGGKKIDTVFYNTGCDREYVRRGLIEHDGYDPGISVRQDRKLSDTMTSAFPRKKGA